MSIYESDVEQEMLGWFEDLGYEVVAGADLAPDGSDAGTEELQAGSAGRTVAGARCIG